MPARFLKGGCDQADVRFAVFEHHLRHGNERIEAAGHRELDVVPDDRAGLRIRPGSVVPVQDVALELVRRGAGRRDQGVARGDLAQIGLLLGLREDVQGEHPRRAAASQAPHGWDVGPG